MKCPFCPNRPNMVKKNKGRDNWWECPQCHKVIGKKKQKEEETAPTEEE